MKRWTAFAAAASLGVAGCASFSPDGGFDEVRTQTQQRIGQTPVWQRTAADGEAAAARVEVLLGQPLSPDGAVELAFLNNRGLQARFASLGIAEADLVQAGRLANPRLGFGRLQGGGATETDRSFLVDVLGLLTMPLARRLEQQRFEAVQLQAVADAVALAGETRRAYVDAVAAQQSAGYAEKVRDAADAANALARRMVEAGNTSPLAQMRQQAFDAEATAQLARAQHRAVAQRERLVRLLGLRDGAALQLPQRLPDLPPAPADAHDAEQTAIDQRLDVQLARRATAATAQALGLTKTTRVVNVLEAGYADKRQSGEPLERGGQITLELPLFDFGAARVARAEAVYRQSLERTAETAVRARSEVREAHAAYRTAYDLARHYRDEVVPLRKRIAEETLLRYNGMLISVFELLDDAREQVASVTAAADALRDFWIAETDLQAALTGGARPDMPAPGTGAPRAAGH